MQLEKVTISFQRKKNLGNYESADASCMLTAYVEPADDKDAVMHGLWEMARENVKAALAPYMQNITVKDLFLGLPVDVQESEEFKQVRELVIRMETGNGN
jgi:hypothetical protein